MPDDPEPIEEVIGWHTVYPDRGCRIMPECLTCWLPSCVFDTGLPAARQWAAETGRELYDLPEPEYEVEPVPAPLIPLPPVEQLREWHAEGRTYRAVADMLGVSVDRVKRVFVTFGPSKRRVGPEEHARILDMFHRDMSVEAIAKTLGRNWRIVNKYVNKELSAERAPRLAQERISQAA